MLLPLQSPLLAFANHHMVKDTLAIVIAQIFTAGLSLVTSSFLARMLTVTDMGTYQLVVSYCGLSVIMALPGMNTIVYKGILKGYDPVYYRVVSLSVLIATVSGMVVFLVSCIAYYYFNSISLALGLFIVALYLPCTGFQKYDSVILGKMKFILSRKLTVFNALIYLVFVGGTAVVTKKYFYCLIAFVAAQYCTIGIGSYCAHRQIVSKERNPSLEKELFKQGWAYTILQIFSTGLLQLDRIILGTIDPRYLAVYHVGSIIPKTIRNNLKTIAVVPVSWWGKRDKEDNAERLFSHGGKIFLFGTGIAVIIGISAPIIIHIFFGERYRASILITILLSLSIPFSLMSVFINSFNMYQEKGSFMRINTYIQNILYIGALTGLTYRYKMYGVVFSVLFRDIYSGVSSQIYFMNYRKRREQAD